ncbi:MAG: hypothetical protein J0H98_08260 [Solirubrobacterales bacterium]|nr:hypothetical protein [Solirubrobacterales bacterium]
MTLPAKPPIVQDWSEANFEKRSIKCRVCGRGDRKIELAHVHTSGIQFDTREAIVEERFHRGKVRTVRVVKINPCRVIPLCGPSTDPATCHGGQHAHRLDVWPFLTEEEKAQVIADVGLNQAIHNCAPLTAESRLDWDANGEPVELAI